MTPLHAILLGLIQGLTEFLPVSSTAHLTLAENALMGRSMPLAFDVLLHVGTLLALLIYFRSDIAALVRALLPARAGDEPQARAASRRLLLALLLAMVPTAVFALATRHFKEAQKDHIWLYGVFLLLTAGLLWAANRISARRAGRGLEGLRWVDALAVGSIQGLGGGFGLSRSGSTLSMGVFCGLDLSASVRFSFLLGIPTIAAAAAKEGLPLVKGLIKGRGLEAAQAFPAGSAHPLLLCALGVAVSALAGYAAIGLLDRLTRRPRLNGFALYCVAAAGVLLWMGLRR